MLQNIKAAPELLLFAATLIMMLARFGGLFQNAELPGWDTPSHYFALTKMAEYLPQFHVTGYLHEWLGGMPMFQFYAPLFFVATAGFWLATFKLIPLLLLFRAAIFLVIFGVIVSFWYFLKSYFGRKVALWGIPLGAVFIFYPKIYSVFGIGAGATIWAGLISSTLGISIVFLWLGFLENMRRREDATRYFILSALGIGTLVLAHTLSLIAGSVLFGIYVLLNAGDKKFVLRALASFALGLGLAAFWLVPFAANLPLSSGEVRGAWDIAINPALLLFPMNFPYLRAGSLVFLALAVFGCVLLAKDRKFIVPALFGGLLAFFLARTQLLAVFPEATVHYQRFLPFMFLLALAAASYAAEWLWSNWASSAPRRKIYFAALIFLSVFNFFYTFDMNAVLDEESPMERQPIGWRWEDFEYAGEAADILEKLKGFDDVERLFVQMPPAEGLAYLGSLHYFSSQVPLKNQQSIITGLYVESAPLTPFLMPTIDALTSGQVQAYGDMRLRLARAFYEQDFSVHLGRLKKFGVNYIVAYSSDFARRMEQTGEAAKVGGTEHFTIFKISGGYPPAYSAEYQPALYLNLDGEIPFRDLALAVFAGEESFDFPVAESPYAIGELNRELLEPFSVIIVSGSGLTSSDLEALGGLGHPIVVLNAKQELAAQHFASGARFINNFEVISKSRRAPYADMPAGWRELEDFLVSYKKQYVAPSAESVRLEKTTDDKLTVFGAGAILINSGYSPYWQRADCKSCRVFRVSPEEMLIFADGKAELEYRPDRLKLIAEMISAMGILVLAGKLFYGKWQLL